MKASRGLGLTHRIKLYVVIISVLAFCCMLIPLVPGDRAAEASSPAYQPATFDLFSMFAEQVLSPSTGKTFTWMPVETRNITDITGWLWLSTSSESSWFNAFVIPCLVRPSGAEGTAKSWVLISCAPDTPDGTVGYIKVTGSRGSEQHRVWLKVTALASQPRLEMSAGEMLTGQGYKDPELQACTGEPITWNLAATNHGGAEETYSLGYQADFPCQVRFLESGGTEISQVTVPGLTHNYLYPNAVNFKMEVIPDAGLPKNQPLDLTVILGPGNSTAATSELAVQIINPGMLFCVNDLSGLRPHAHQVMPSETTSFIFHVTNLESAAADIDLSLSGDCGDWEVGLDTDTIEALPPGETAHVSLSATPPDTAGVGERLDLAVTAASSLGPEEQVSISSEVTEVRNVYFWAIDSMDPEYLYLNRAGTGPGSEGDWLMPNLHAFMEEGVNYTDARVYLPSATDMDHTNALAGTYTGTQGVYMVGGTFRGFTEYDEVITAPNTMDLMLYGPDGKPLERIYEVAKDLTGGKALCGFWSNKNWLADLEGGEGTIGEGAVDIVGHSERFPLFFPSPYKYSAAGDPRTDEDPWDPMSGPFSMCFYTDTTREIIIPTLLGQFNLLLGMGLYLIPVRYWVFVSRMKAMIRSLSRRRPAYFSTVFCPHKIFI